MKKIRAVQFINNMNDGGAETLVAGTVSFLDPDRFESYVLNIHRVDSANFRRLENAGVKVRWFYPGWNVPVRAFNKLFRKTYVPGRILNFIRKEKIDVIHAHLEVLPYLVPIADRIRDVPIFYTCHTVPEVMLPVGNKDHNAARYLIDHNGLRLIALHENMRKQLNELFHVDNTEVVLNGVDTDRFGNADLSVKDAKKRLGIPEDAFVVGNVARLDPIKNQDLLLEITERIRERGRNAFLLLVGEGSEKDRLTETIRRKNLEGHCLILEHRTDMPEIYRAMDVFVLPSRYEGFPLVALEAQAAGLLTCLSDAVTDEAVVSDHAYKTSLNESADCWAEFILEKHREQEEKGPCTNDQRMEKIDIRHYVSRLADLYEQALAGRRHS